MRHSEPQELILTWRPEIAGVDQLHSCLGVSGDVDRNLEVTHHPLPTPVKRVERKLGDGSCKILALREMKQLQVMAKYEPPPDPCRSLCAEHIPWDRVVRRLIPVRGPRFELTAQTYKLHLIFLPCIHVRSAEPAWAGSCMVQPTLIHNTSYDPMSVRLNLQSGNPTVGENTTVVDAHTHFWDPALRHHRWLRGTRLDRPFTPADVDAGGHPVAGFIFVEADCLATEALDEAKWASDLSSQAAPVLGIVAHAPLDQPRALGAHLEALGELPLVVGVRRLLQDEPVAAFQSSDLVRGLRALVAFDYTFDACVRHDQLTALRSLARDCPDTQFVLDHVGKPPIASGSRSTWRRDLRALAACPNVSCKLSGLATQAATDWTRGDIHPYLIDAIEAFGPARCMYGSDWPVALLATTYSRWLETVIEATETLSAEERSAILADNATRIYGLRVRTDYERTWHAGG